MGLALCRQSHMHTSKVVLVGNEVHPSTLFRRVTPTMGFNVGSLELDSGPELTLWDIGGYTSPGKTTWRAAMPWCWSRLGVALGRVLGDERVRGSPLVLVSKMKLAEAMGLQEVMDGWTGAVLGHRLGGTEAMGSLATLRDR